MTTETRNEGRQRDVILRVRLGPHMTLAEAQDHINLHGRLLYITDEEDALRIERRATVERIRARLKGEQAYSAAHVPYLLTFEQLLAILDEEAPQ